MTFELHIWGPAFSLPSIDPQCLAALAYVSSLAKREDLSWQPVASNDPSISPTRQLPTLRHHSTIISGLENIIDYLDTQAFPHSLESSALDNSPAKRADLAAFTSHILHHSPPLLSLSLFVSTPNYTTVTRPAYSALLPWPTQYIVPPQLRSRAQAQTAHLGLISPDLIDDDQDNDTAGQRNKSIIPESLRRLGSSRTGGSGQAKTTVTGALAQQPHAGSARFRLDALVDDFCAPLSDLLGQDGKNKNKRQQKYMLSSSLLDNSNDNMNDDKNESETPSSLDCLAAAHLSLMLHPDLPQDWLATRIQQRWPALATYAARMGNELWGGEKYTETLPWRTTDPLPQTWTASLSSSSSLFADYALSPLMLGLSSKSLYTAPLAATASTAAPTTTSGLEGTRTATTINDDETPQQQEEAHTLPTVLLTATAAAAALAAVASASVYFLAPSFSPSTPLPSSGEWNKARNLSEMGEAGAMLEEGVEFGALGM